MRVFIYWNLHRKCWSIKALSGANKGRVVCHAEAWEILGATFKVSEAGRQRVIREKRKNVHAGVCGVLQGVLPISGPMFPEIAPLFNAGAFDPENISACNASNGSVGVTYNPYAYSSFVARDTEEPIHSARGAWAVGWRVTANLAP